MNYTQPFLNNMHITAPTLYYLENLARKRPGKESVEYVDLEENVLTALPG